MLMKSIRIILVFIFITSLLACAQNPVDSNQGSITDSKEVANDIDSQARVFDESGYDQFGYDKSGYDQYGFDRSGIEREMRAIFTEEQIANFISQEADLNLTDEQVAALDKAGISFLQNMSPSIIEQLPADQVDAIKRGNNSKLSDETMALFEMPDSGELAPEFELVDNFGKKHRLADFRGKYVLLDIWGTWCPPCVEALPKLADAYSRVDKSKVEFIGVCVNCPDFEEFIAEEKLSWVQLSEEGRGLSDAYGVSGYPAVLLIDPDGYIIENNLTLDSAEEIIELLNQYIE
jgi:peroxiredoxin